MPEPRPPAVPPPDTPHPTATAVPPTAVVPPSMAAGFAPPGYEVLGEIGRGGMGVVYKARDNLHRLVALKVLPESVLDSDEARERFRTEAEAVARLQHPHIVQIYAWDEYRGRPFFALEYVPGGSLDRHLRDRPPAPAEAAALVEVLARAVHAAHAEGIVHRDLKPANVLLAPPVPGSSGTTAYGFPKVGDFGLARLRDGRPDRTAPGAVLGTASYMAPEQAGGEPAGPAADVYALGVILYECLTGHVPFRAPTAQQTMEMVRTRPAPPPRQTAPGVPAALEAVCLRCLAKQPADRYPSAAALADDLRRWLDGQPTQACVAPASAARRRWKFRIRISITISFCLLLTAGLWTFRNSARDAARTGGAAHEAAPIGEVASAAPLTGQFDVRVWESTGAKDPDGHPRFVAGNPRRQGVRLNQAVPLTARDWVRIEAQLNRPAYLYVVWIDTTSRAWPLYPWRNDDWARRPADEQPRDRLSLPDTPAGMAPLDVGPAGVETLLLLARAAPLTDAEAARLPGLFAGLPPATTPAVGRAAWFENGELATKEKEHDRGHVRLDQAQDGPDVELRLQKLLKEKLRPLFSYTRAVCFDNTGTK